MAIIKNMASQGLYVYAHDTAADAPKTGDAAQITATLSLSGAAAVATNDTNPTEIGAGVYWFDLTQAETNAGALALLPVSSTPNVVLDPVLVLTQEAVITHQTGDAFARLGEPAGASVSADIAAIKAQTDEIGPAGAGLTALATQSSVDTIDGIVDAILADTSTDGVVLTAAAVDAILDEAVEGALTLRQIMRIMLAVLAGKSAGGGTARVTFRNVADTANRVVGTVDAYGNRTAITLDGS